MKMTTIQIQMMNDQKMMMMKMIHLTTMMMTMNQATLEKSPVATNERTQIGIDSITKQRIDVTGVPCAFVVLHLVVPINQIKSQLITNHNINIDISIPSA